jgi:hypothetical protein
LYKLYEAHMEDDDKDRYSVSEICSMFSEEVPRKLVQSALELLFGDDHQGERPIRRHGKAGGHAYVISQEGILRVERALLRRDSVAAYLHTRPDATLEEVAGFEGIFYTPGERADVDSWVPLELDRESDEFKQTLQLLEESYETIRGDNGFAAKYPSQRAGILASLEEGLDWLKNKTPSTRQLTDMLIKPLQWIATTFGNSVLAEAGKRAAE